MVQEIWVEKWDKSGLNSPPSPQHGHWNCTITFGYKWSEMNIAILFYI